MNDTPTVSGADLLPPMIDTHCHLDDHQFALDLGTVLEKSRDANVTRWILIGYDPQRWNSAISLAGQTEGMFHTVGVHPACAEQWTDAMATRLGDLATSSGAVGIGEAGLDFYRDNAPMRVQSEAFRGQLEIAAERNLPVVIHMRDAEQELLKLLQSVPSLPTLIFHSFDGSDKLMDFVIESGSYVGVGGLATRQKSHRLREELKRLSLERILLETDSPYLVPARQKDRRNEPAHIATIVAMMSRYFDVSPEHLAATTTANAEVVFGLRDE